MIERPGSVVQGPWAPSDFIRGPWQEGQVTIYQGDLWSCHLPRGPGEKVYVLNPTNPNLAHDSGAARALRDRFPTLTDRFTQDQRLNNRLPFHTPSAHLQTNKEHGLVGIVHCCYLPRQGHQTVKDQQVVLEEVMNLGIQTVLDMGEPPPIRIFLPVFGGDGFQYETHAFTLAFHRLIWANPTIRFTLVTHSVEEYEELTEQLTDRVTLDQPRNKGTPQAKLIYGPQRREPTRPGAPPAQGTQVFDQYRPPAYNYGGSELVGPHHPAFWVNPEQDHAPVQYPTPMDMATPDLNPAPILVRPIPVRGLTDPNRGRDPMHSQVQKAHDLYPVPDYRYLEPRRQQREESHTLPSHKHPEGSHRSLKAQKEEPPTRNQKTTKEQSKSTSKQRPQPPFLEEGQRKLTIPYILILIKLIIN